MPKTDGTQPQNGGGSILGRVSQQLAELEKRDWQLWMVVVGTGILVGAGLLALAFPGAFLTNDHVEFQFRVSKAAYLGLLALLILFNSYVVSRRMELRRLRQQVISTTLQGELIRLQSFTDPLTEVYNRRSLDDMVAHYTSRARRQKKPLSFLLVDVDRFRDVNTSFGHLTGDFVLSEIAMVLKNSVRGSDAVVRYGGDEFLIILGDSSTEGALQVIDRIQTSMDEWNREGHLEKTSITLSIGVAEWTDGKKLDEVLDVADRRMYSTKAVQTSPPRN